MGVSMWIFTGLMALVLILAVCGILLELFADDDELHTDDRCDHFPPTCGGSAA